jgi:hypothetical protein
MVLSRPRRLFAVGAVVAVLCVLFAAPAAADTQWVLWTNGKTGLARPRVRRRLSQPRPM